MVDVDLLGILLLVNRLHGLLGIHCNIRSKIRLKKEVKELGYFKNRFISEDFVIKIIKGHEERGMLSIIGV